MSIKRINEFPDGSGNLTSDDILLFMDDPSGDAITKKISLSQLNTILNGTSSFLVSGNYATLVNGKIPAIQLPSYVDDVLEFNNLASFPSSGEGDKIYVTKDSNKTYRWSGSAYIEISASPSSTDAVTEGSVNKYYTDARASAAAPVQSVAGKTGTITLVKSDVGLGNVDNTSDANKPVSAAQASADTAVQNAASTDATTKANNAQAFAIQRSNHTGTQAIDTINGLQVALDGKSATSHTHDDRYYTKSEVDNLLATLRGIFVSPAPTELTATAGNAQVTLSWTAPTGVIAQAAPITDYRKQYSTDGGATWTTFSAAASTATSATVTGLTNGTAYVFRVAAINAVGVGAYTAASAAVTPTAGTPPNAPTSLTATAGNAQISLAWTAPSAPGTYAITGYTVEYTPSGGSAVTVNTGSTSTSYTLTELTNGTTYTVRVAGVSASGTGTYSAASSSVTPSAGPPIVLSTPYGAVTGSGTVGSKWAWQSGSGFSEGNSAVLLRATGSVTLQATVANTGGGNCDWGESRELAIYSAANARIRTMARSPASETLEAGQYIVLELVCAHARAEVWVV